MVEVDPKVAQKAFKDYQRGHHVPDIIQRHGLTARQFNQTIKFETAVNSRVQMELARQQAKLTKVEAPKQMNKPAAKAAKGK